jgi:hypothetical protein
MSRGFLSSVGGIALTLLAWHGPWEWPAWPAFTVISLVFGTGGWYLELPFAHRAVVIVVLIAVNVGVWAGVLYGMTVAIVRARDGV